jgi:hypothetical protein
MEGAWSPSSTKFKIKIFEIIFGERRKEEPQQGLILLACCLQN